MDLKKGGQALGKVALLLLNGVGQDEIRRRTGLSLSTISRVSVWRKAGSEDLAIRDGRNMIQAPKLPEELQTALLEAYDAAHRLDQTEPGRSGPLPSREEVLSMLPPGIRLDHRNYYSFRHALSYHARGLRRETGTRPGAAPPMTAPVAAAAIKVRHGCCAVEAPDGRRVCAHVGWAADPRELVWVAESGAIAEVTASFLRHLDRSLPEGRKIVLRTCHAGPDIKSAVVLRALRSLPRERIRIEVVDDTDTSALHLLNVLVGSAATAADPLPLITARLRQLAAGYASPWIGLNPRLAIPIFKAAKRHPDSADGEDPPILINARVDERRKADVKK